MLVQFLRGSILDLAPRPLSFWKQKLPKVNQELALKLMEEGDEEDQAGRRKKGKVRRGRAAPHWYLGAPSS